MSERDRDRNEGLTQQLVRRAARHAPSQLAQRLEEEWLADLLCREGYLSRLGFALGCWWAVNGIAREHSLAPAAASATASTCRGTTALYAGYDLPFLSRRTLVLLSILALHVLLIYCFANGLANRIATAMTQPTHVVVIDEARPRDVPPPPPTPTLIRPTPDIPRPVVTLNLPAEPSQITVTGPPAHPQEPPVRPNHPPAAVQRVLGGPDRGFPNTDDYYPETSRRLGETGSSVVRVCVDGRGRLTALPTLVQSSGSARLDNGAINLARAGTGHYRPTTEDGQPVPSCYSFRISFTLRDECAPRGGCRG